MAQAYACGKFILSSFENPNWNYMLPKTFNNNLCLYQWNISWQGLIAICVEHWLEFLDLKLEGWEVYKKKLLIWSICIRFFHHSWHSKWTFKSRDNLKTQNTYKYFQGFNTHKKIRSCNSRKRNHHRKDLSTFHINKLLIEKINVLMYHTQQ